MRIDFSLLPKIAIVVGSREFPRKDLVERLVDQLRIGTVVYSGGAKGVDTWAVQRAKAGGLDYQEFVVPEEEWRPPSWLGRIDFSAGHRRNRRMVDRAVKDGRGPQGVCLFGFRSPYTRGKKVGQPSSGVTNCHDYGRRLGVGTMMVDTDEKGRVLGVVVQGLPRTDDE